MNPRVGDVADWGPLEFPPYDWLMVMPLRQLDDRLPATESDSNEGRREEEEACDSNELLLVLMGMWRDPRAGVTTRG